MWGGHLEEEIAVDEPSGVGEAHELHQLGQLHSSPSVRQHCPPTCGLDTWCATFPMWAGVQLLPVAAVTRGRNSACVPGAAAAGLQATARCAASPHVDPLRVHSEPHSESRARERRIEGGEGEGARRRQRRQPRLLREQG